MAQVSLERKKELEEPDEFMVTAGRALGFVVERKKEVIAAVSGVLALLLVIVGWGAYSDSREKKAFASYAAQLESYEARQKEAGEAAAMKETLKGADPFVSGWSGTRAGGLAAAWYSAMHFKQGEFDKSIAMCEKALKSIGSGASYRNGLLLVLGLSYEAKGDTAKALTYYEKVVASDSPLKKGEALFHMGLIYGATGDEAKREEVLDRLQREYPENLFYQVIQEKPAG